MKNIYLVIISLFFSSYIASAETAPHTFKLTTRNFDEVLEKLEHRKVLVEKDPLYHKDTVYYGYSLRSLLRALGVSVKPETALRFICSDGFKQVVIPEQVDLSKAYLASKALSKSLGSPLALIGEGKTTLDPGPYLLVWKDWSSEGTAPRPHGIVSLEVGQVSDFLGKSHPSISAPDDVRAGFKLFQDNCIACHTVNLDGGAIGPELNVPKNVTEYWAKEHFFGFVSNPQEYRYKSRMVVPPLEKSQIALIYKYLVHMKDQKVCSSLAECREKKL